MLRVELRPGLRGCKWACLRPICGHDEVTVNGTGAEDGLAFLDRLLVEAPGTAAGTESARTLPVCDRDRLYAALYLNYFGAQIEGTIDCRECGEPFELRLSLSDLIANLEGRAAESSIKADEEGIYTLPDGRRFRLPTGEDLESVAGLDPGEASGALLKRCVVNGDFREAPETLQDAMEEVGPVLDLDLDATCPKCATPQPVRFDIRSHLLHALAFEKRFLVHEIHCIARVYGWGYGDILRLTREDRQTFVRLIEASRAPQRRALA